MRKIITEEILEMYSTSLRNEEKSPLTIQKYIRDIRKLKDYADEYANDCKKKNRNNIGGKDVGKQCNRRNDKTTECELVRGMINGGDSESEKEITKEIVLAFKDKLYNHDHYKIASVNSILESINRFFEYIEWYELRVKCYRVQRESFTPEEKYMTKEEYKRLLAEAKRRGKKRLFLIMETLASTGMRVSEIRYVTFEALKTGIIEVNNKGKIRKVLLTKKMRIQLISYAHEQGIGSGMIFRTSSDNPIDRTNIWKEMKSLCDSAGVEKSKVFPHSLRRLFARSLYKIHKDLAKIADILGHSSIETTRRYVRETSREHRRLLEQTHLVVGYW